MISNSHLIKKSLAQLPYREMVILSTELSESLKVNAEKIAKVLAHMDMDEAPEIVKQEQQILGRCFRRKKSFNICPLPNKKIFRISCPAYEEAVITDNIREGISEMLDKIVVKEVLSD